MAKLEIKTNDRIFQYDRYARKDWLSGCKIKRRFHWWPCLLFVLAFHNRGQKPVAATCTIVAIGFCCDTFLLKTTFIWTNLLLQART